MKTFAFAALLTVSSSALASAQNSTRDGLKAIIGNYFSAVQAHNPSLVSTAPKVRFTGRAASRRLPRPATARPSVWC